MVHAVGSLWGAKLVLIEIQACHAGSTTYQELQIKHVSVAGPHIKFLTIPQRLCQYKEIHSVTYTQEWS